MLLNRIFFLVVLALCTLFNSAQARYVEADPIGAVLYQHMAAQNIAPSLVVRPELAAQLYHSRPQLNHLYGYVNGNPLSFVDPLGLAVKCKTVLKIPFYDVQACTDDRSQPSEQDAKDAKRMSGKELDKACKNNGYKDAHDMKKELGLDSKHDIFVDKQGNMYSGPRQGTGDLQYLHMNKTGVY